MEENNNNLGDFFRKRLSSTEGEDGDWFNPDLRTDDLVLQGLVASAKGKKSKKRALFFLLPCLFFLGMLAYIVHLKQDIALLSDSKLPTIAQGNSIPLTSITTTTNNETTTLSNFSTIINEKRPETEVKNTNSKNKRQQVLWSNLELKNQQLQKLIVQKDKKIRALQLELSQNNNPSDLFEEAENITNFESNFLFPYFEPQFILGKKRQTVSGSKQLFQQEEWNGFLVLAPPIKLGGTQEIKNLSILKPALLAISLEGTKPSPDVSFSLKKKQKRKRNSFEIGVHVGLQALFTEKEIDILNQRIIADQELTTERLLAPYVGVNIAYSPIENLWIRTGVQVGGNTDYLGQKMGIVYNDGEEYLLPSGGRGSDLVLNTSTGYTKVVNTLQLTVPNATTNGDLLELDYVEELNTRHLQIPLSVEYFFSSKKWQPFIHLGAKWNIFTYEYKTLGINVVSENQAINFDLDEGDTNTKTLQYMSFMTGAGLSWNLNSKFSLRTTLGVEGNFLLQKNKTTDTDYSKSGLFANFGLYYKF
jgi:hypothetical protein